ncbi:MAG: helix-turn-helix domain-containing protein [Clostridiales bacterium]|nr:helix-turn-helix domain-containing protein [Clostridiales bacterium]
MYDVLKYINENLQYELNLTDTAKRFSYSKWYFCEAFKSFTGLTFTEYIRHRRMQLAAAEVLNGKKITEIAQKCGYDTQCGFNKAFLKEFGCMPSEFRKNEQYYKKQYEERRKMYSLSDRCEILKQAAINERPNDEFKSAQRDYYYLRGMYKGYEAEQTNESVVASGLCEVIQNAPPIIHDGELIVGYNYGSTDSYDWGDLNSLKVNWPVFKEKMKSGGFSDSELEEYYEKKLQSYKLFSISNPDTTISEKAMMLSSDSAIGAYLITSNHSVIGYEKVLRLGFEGLLEEVERCSSDSPFYRGLKKICKAACTLGERYAEEAEKAAKNESNPNRQKELRQIAQICRQVPRKGARSFAEAVQSLWFAHIINTWEDFINANSLGRLDQILYPYYKHDIEAGIITKKEAFELICCLWIKLYRDYDVQQSCVGGCDSNGKSAVNELSYLMLDATEALGFIRCISVRFSPDTEKSFIRRALEVVGHVQKGVPFFFNDSVMIPALTSHGIDLEDARDYTQIGCVETVIPGRSNPHAFSARCNFLRAIEYTFNNGKSLCIPELEPGIPTGKLASFKNFEQLKHAVFMQIENMLDSVCQILRQQLLPSGDLFVRLYKSLLTEGCTQSGLDFNKRGAKYDYYQVDFMGIPNLADSLAAEIMGFACDTLDKLSEKYEMNFQAQPFTFTCMTTDGRIGCATPDGRHRGDNIAYSVSPMQGRDFNGFTALINSLCALPTTKAPGCTSAIVEVEPKLFSDKNLSAFADILLAAAAQGLCNIQFNVVDADILRDAQLHPENHRNLAVRVSGFSQKFCLLDKNMQDHIIARTKHQFL